MSASVSEATAACRICSWDSGRRAAVTGAHLRPDCPEIVLRTHYRIPATIPVPQHATRQRTGSAFLDDLASSLLTGSLGKATFSARNGGRAAGRAFPRAGAPLGRR